MCTVWKYKTINLLGVLISVTIVNIMTFLWCWNLCKILCNDFLLLYANFDYYALLFVVTATVLLQRYIKETFYQF